MPKQQYSNGHSRLDSGLTYVLLSLPKHMLQTLSSFRWQVRALEAEPVCPPDSEEPWLLSQVRRAEHMSLLPLCPRND